MKKNFLGKLSAVTAIALSACFAFTGCGGMFGGGGGGSGGDSTPKEYTIQYSDDAGTHTLTVESGALYQLDSVPYKYGYEFLGLYDAATGGVQYVGANGAAVAPYPDSVNKVLYPQFKPIEYTVILNYGEAAVTGARSLTVAYDAALPALPTDLTLAHNVFKGWYTAEGCGGTQVADAYGNMPGVSVLTSKNFELDDQTHRTNLYAGFELEKYAVTFHFGGEIADETMQIEYGTPIKNIVPATRNAEKQAVLLWSTRENDTEKQDIFNGNITEAKELYAAEWAPVLELDGDGAEVTPVVARAGSTVSLPTPTKPLAKFLHWETLGGEEYTATEMPATSTSLKAVWQGKLEFDENGGSDVNDISEPAGSSITLPSPEREGYIFAGWYTAEKDLYISSKMPSAGVALKAGWYKEKTKTITVVENDFDNKVTVKDDSGYSKSHRWKIDLSGILPQIPNNGINIDYVVHFRWAGVKLNYSAKGGIALYEGAELNSTYCLYGKGLSHDADNDKYIQDSFSGSATIHYNLLYLYYYGLQQGGWSSNDVAFFDVYIDLTYPDTTYLYL